MLAFLARGIEERKNAAEAVRLAIRDSFTGPTGLTPGQVAERTLEAIRAGEFWVITHPGERSAFEARFTTALAHFPLHSILWRGRMTRD